MTAKEVAFAEFLAPRAGYSGGFAFALSDRTRLCIGCGSIQLTEFAINFGNAIERELELDPSLDSWDHRAWRHFLDTPLKTLMKRILKYNRRLGFAVRPARWRPFLTNNTWTWTWTLMTPSRGHFLQARAQALPQSRAVRRRRESRRRRAEQGRACGRRRPRCRRAASGEATQAKKRKTEVNRHPPGGALLSTLPEEEALSSSLPPRRCAGTLDFEI